jgi:Flp pilus assembly pilin Flp
MKISSFQRGQGMTEYIIIVALIAVAAIGVTRQFGGVIRHQTAAIAQEMSGTNGGAEIGLAAADATEAVTAAGEDTNLGNFNDNN